MTRKEAALGGSALSEAEHRSAGLRGQPSTPVRGCHCLQGQVRNQLPTSSSGIPASRTAAKRVDSISHALHPRGVTAIVASSFSSRNCPTAAKPASVHPRRGRRALISRPLPTDEFGHARRRDPLEGAAVVHLDRCFGTSRKVARLADRPGCRKEEPPILEHVRERHDVHRTVHVASRERGEWLPFEKVPHRFRQLPLGRPVYRSAGHRRQVVGHVRIRQPVRA